MIDSTRTASLGVSAVMVAAILALLSADAIAARTERTRGVYSAYPLEKNYETELIEDAGELEEYFRRRGLRFTSPAHDAWLDRVASGLLPDPSDHYIEYRFGVIRDPSPNAFALPDGQIYVTTGMLARLKDEAQLAGLLGHEISHVAGHHGLLAVRSSHQGQVATTVLSAILIGVGGDYAALADLGQNLAFSLSVAGYSRALESEADRWGFQGMSDAGYDGEAMAELFQILLEDPEGEAPRLASKWNTHPKLEARMAGVRELAAAVPEHERDRWIRGAGTFEQYIWPLALMSVGDYITIGYPRSALDLARRMAADYPQDAYVHIAKGDAFRALGPYSEHEGELSNRERKKNLRERRRWTTSEREARALESETGRANLANNLAAAVAAYQKALELDGEASIAHRGLAQAYERQGEIRQAARSWLAYARANPEAPDRASVVQRIKDLTAAIKAQSEEENP